MIARRRVAGGLALLAAGAAATPCARAQGTLLDGLAAKIDADYPDVDSVVVLRHGQPLFEHHRAGDAQRLYDVQSVTKSVLALLVGIALARGAFNGLDQPVLPLLAPDEDGMRNDPTPVTVRHLLTMTAGFERVPRWNRRDGDALRYLVARRRVATPGSRFEYDNLGYNLLALALEAATQQPADVFAREQLFTPLGIDRFEWERGPNGHALGFAGLRLRTADMARIGQLLLQQGRWGERAVVPAAFVDDTMTAHSAGGPPVGLAYGYGWWVVPGTARPVVLASGLGGQMIWLSTAPALVIAVTAKPTAEANARGQSLALLRGVLVNAVLAVPPR